jgi:hypothetical protein
MQAAVADRHADRMPECMPEVRLTSLEAGSNLGWSGTCGQRVCRFTHRCSTRWPGVLAAVVGLWYLRIDDAGDYLL